MKSEPVFYDDFSIYPLGPVPFDYSPWGEYHCQPEVGKLGPWHEVTTHYSWRQSNGNWRIAIEGNRQIMEQTFFTDKSYPMLIAETPVETDGELNVAVRPLSWAAPVGIVFGYLHSRDFFCVMLAQSQARLIHRRHEDDTELAQADISLEPDLYYLLSVTWTIDGIIVLLDGEEIMTVEGQEPSPGLTGLIANAPARFADFRLDGTGPPHIDMPVPVCPAQPALWKKIDISGFGTDRNIRIGDINGDGQNELVIAQQKMFMGSGDYCHITCLTAIDLDGNELWQHGVPGKQGQTTADLCFQVHDLNGDGKAEVIYTRDFQLIIADGATGKDLNSIPTPFTEESKYNPGGYPLARIIGDALYFCDLQGTGRPDTVVLKDRYHHCWVYDKHLKLLWDYDCQTGHYPVSYDIEGDGREELLMGYTLLNGDGIRQWELETFDHADSSVIGEFGPPGSGLRAAIAGSDAGFFLLDAKGKQIAHHPMGHAQTIAIAKLREDIEGLQIVVNTYWGAPGITLILDHEGNILREFEPMHYASLLNPVNWGPDETEYLLLSTHPFEGGLMDGYGQRAVMFPDDGHPVLCCDSRDIDGDGVDEILTWDHDSIWIYKPDPLPQKPVYPIRNADWNDS
ncbi:hypothetical protein ACFL4W_05040, partial [Planctomycetota bacterium]